MATNTELIYRLLEENNCNHWFRDNEDMLKLAEYLDKNACVVMPCNIGDTLYDVGEYIRRERFPDEYELKSDQMIIEKDENGNYYFSYDDMWIWHDDIGKTLFFNEKEAEQAKKGGVE